MIGYLARKFSQRLRDLVEFQERNDSDPGLNMLTKC